METQLGQKFNWEPVKKEVERVNAFLEELTRLSIKHSIVLAHDVYIEIQELGGEFKAPCGYVLRPHATCAADQDMSLNEHHTEFSWKTRSDLVEEDSESDEEKGEEETTPEA